MRSCVALKWRFLRIQLLWWTGETDSGGGFRTYLKVRHIFVALLWAGVVWQLHIPEAGQLVDQERVLLDHRIENVLRAHTYNRPIQELILMNFVH